MAFWKERQVHHFKIVKLKNYLWNARSLMHKNFEQKKRSQTAELACTIPMYLGSGLLFRGIFLDLQNRIFDVLFKIDFLEIQIDFFD